MNDGDEWRERRNSQLSVWFDDDDDDDDDGKHFMGIQSSFIMEGKKKKTSLKLCQDWFEQLLNVWLQIG